MELLILGGVIELMRTPFKPKRISEIQSGDKVSVVGTVVNVSDGEFILDDGTGQATVTSNSMPEPNKLYRIFGKAYVDDSVSIRADIIQPMDKLNIELYKKVLEVLKNV